MRKIYILVVCLLLSYGYLAGQDSIVEVARGTDLNKIVENSYLLPEFTHGYAIDKDGNISQADLNYNILLEKMQFKKDGQTYDMANPKNTTLVTIGGRNFVNVGTGFAYVIEQKDKQMLAMKRSIEVKVLPPEGAYGMRSESASVIRSTYISGADFGRNHLRNSSQSMTITDDVRLRYITTYYIISNKKTLVANKKNFTKVFSKNKKVIETYINDNNINFNNENHLKQLFTYCTAL